MLQVLYRLLSGSLQSSFLNQLPSLVRMVEGGVAALAVRLSVSPAQIVPGVAVAVTPVGTGFTDTVTEAEGSEIQPVQN